MLRHMQVSETRAVDLIHAAGTGAVLTLLATPPERRDSGLAADLLDAVLRQVLRDDPGPPGADYVSTAVALRAGASQLAVLSDTERALLTEWLDRVIEAR